MRQIDDIQPLADMADAEFLRLSEDAWKAVNRLADFWTNLYGPNDALEGARESLRSLDVEWFSDDTAHIGDEVSA